MTFDTRSQPSVLSGLRNRKVKSDGSRFIVDSLVSVQVWLKM